MLMIRELQPFAEVVWRPIVIWHGGEKELQRNRGLEEIREKLNLEQSPTVTRKAGNA